MHVDFCIDHRSVLLCRWLDSSVTLCLYRPSNPCSLRFRSSDLAHLVDLWIHQEPTRQPSECNQGCLPDTLDRCHCCRSKLQHCLFPARCLKELTHRVLLYIYLYIYKLSYVQTVLIIKLRALTSCSSCAPSEPCLLPLPGIAALRRPGNSFANILHTSHSDLYLQTGRRSEVVSVTVRERMDDAVQRNTHPALPQFDRERCSVRPRHLAWRYSPTCIA